jgi:hypothetical protein
MNSERKCVEGVSSYNALSPALPGEIGGKRSYGTIFSEKTVNIDLQYC